MTPALLGMLCALDVAVIAGAITLALWALEARKDAGR